MIGIHDNVGSYSDKWISYCEDNNIPFKRVNCLSSDILQHCEDIDALLWHWTHGDPINHLIARNIIISLEIKGINVYPNIKTCWHYDDKVAQKYLLESINAPLVSTWVFTNKQEALQWISNVSWPKVFKLRCGAGSSNVLLVKSKRQAISLCNKAFSRGFRSHAGYFTDVDIRMRKITNLNQFLNKIHHAPQAFLNVLNIRNQLPRERGYIYFQEFLPQNEFDTRITIIGNRAFGFQRMNRSNDFRASGSGNITYDYSKIDRRCIEIAFQVANKLRTQSLAFDFLHNQNNEPQILEISYCFAASAVHACEGHWDQQGNWHEGHTWPENAIMEDILLKHE